MAKYLLGFICLWLAVMLTAVEAQKFCDGDCYDLLGLTQRATKEDIKRVYKKFSKMYHPDKNPSRAGEAKFKRIAQAYEVLIDDKMRRKYDHEIRHPTGWVSSDGDFIGQTGDVDIRIILLALVICIGIIGYSAFRFLDLKEYFMKTKPHGKPRKAGKAAKAGKNN